MKITEIVGICGFIAAFLHICWQVYIQRSQNRERVSAKVSPKVSRGTDVCVRVHNFGVVPVHLAKVELIVESGSVQRKFLFQSVIVRWSIPEEDSPGGLGEEHWCLGGKPTYDKPLTRGEAYNFVLVLKKLELSEILSKARTSKIRVSICSNGGEICRVQKKDVLMLLDIMAK